MGWLILGLNRLGLSMGRLSVTGVMDLAGRGADGCPRPAPGYSSDDGGSRRVKGMPVSLDTFSR